jgi:hypothetical protein
MLSAPTGHNVAYVLKNSEVIAQCWEPSDYAGNDTTAQTLANAALIAAAPAMYEALEKIDLACNHLATGQVVWENAPILIQQFIDISRAALAQARGDKTT